ncbi:MAG: 50S ribosomal protein L4 [Betaproteobacteria bacterium RBG_16_58_11]|mgnify:FL=1|nr:MAG: 50S ribosomal protein L4 [Betaproteobacteria bacterium RBG_16_58_11]OFZ99215.1 MAG: 50S ribosomal protein L4 [Betaproteobacteria bacterium RBG_19FT_COMBO_58_11]
MELKLINEQGAQVSSVQASDTTFGREYNEALVHQVVTSFLANARSGTRAQLDRGEVSHTTHKPWRQKGTGRARAGMSSSPIWRGGGKAFPNSPDENFSQKVNRKMYRASMQAILSELARQGRLMVIEDLKVEGPKTKALAQKLKGMGYEQVLIVTDNVDENLYLSSRNLANVLVMEAQHADPYSLVRYPNVLLTKSAVKKFEELLA